MSPIPTVELGPSAKAVDLEERNRNLRKFEGHSVPPEPQTGEWRPIEIEGVKFHYEVGKESEYFPAFDKFLEDTRQMRQEEANRIAIQHRLDVGREIGAGALGAAAGAVGVATGAGAPFDIAVPPAAAAVGRYATSAVAEAAKRSGLLPADIDTGFNPAGLGRDAKSALLDFAVGGIFSGGTAAYRGARASLYGVRNPNALRIARLMHVENERLGPRGQLEPNIALITTGPWKTYARVAAGLPLIAGPIRRSLRTQAGALQEVESDILSRAARLNAAAPIASHSVLGSDLAEGWFRLNKEGQEQFLAPFEAMLEETARRDPTAGLNPAPTVAVAKEVIGDYRSRLSELKQTLPGPQPPKRIGGKPPPDLKTAQRELAATSYADALEAHRRTVASIEAANAKAQADYAAALKDYEEQVAIVDKARARIKGSPTPGPKPELPGYPEKPKLKLAGVPKTPKRPAILEKVELEGHLAAEGAGQEVPTGELFKGSGKEAAATAKAYEFLSQYQDLGSFITLKQYREHRRQLTNALQTYRDAGGRDPRVFEDFGRVQATLEGDLERLRSKIPGLADTFKQHYDNESAFLLILDKQGAKKLSELFPNGQPVHPEALEKAGDFLLDASPTTIRELRDIAPPRTIPLAARAKLASVFEDPKNYKTYKLGYEQFGETGETGTRILSVDQTREELGLSRLPGPVFDEAGLPRWSSDPVQAKRRAALEEMLDGTGLNLQDLDNYLSVVKVVEDLATGLPEAGATAKRRLGLGAASLMAGAGGVLAGTTGFGSVGLLGALSVVAMGRGMSKVLANPKEFRNIIQALQTAPEVQAAMRSGSEFARGAEQSTILRRMTNPSKPTASMLQATYYLAGILKEMAKGQPGAPPVQDAMDLSRRFDARRKQGQVGTPAVPRSPLGTPSR